MKKIDKKIIDNMKIKDKKSKKEFKEVIEKEINDSVNDTVLKNTITENPKSKLLLNKIKL